MKMSILFLNDKMPGQIMHSVSIYGILTTKKNVLKDSFHILLPLTFALIMIIQKFSANLFTLYFPLYLFFHFGTVPGRFSSLTKLFNSARVIRCGFEVSRVH